MHVAVRETREGKRKKEREVVPRERSSFEREVVSREREREGERSHFEGEKENRREN